jgi:hypothetical protein
VPNFQIQPQYSTSTIPIANTDKTKVFKRSFLICLVWGLLIDFLAGEETFLVIICFLVSEAIFSFFDFRFLLIISIISCVDTRALLKVKFDQHDTF